MFNDNLGFVQQQYCMVLTTVVDMNVNSAGVQSCHMTTPKEIYSRSCALVSGEVRYRWNVFCCTLNRFNVSSTWNTFMDFQVSLWIGDTLVLQSIWLPALCHSVLSLQSLHIQSTLQQQLTAYVECPSPNLVPGFGALCLTMLELMHWTSASLLISCKTS